jgi:transposase
VIAKKQPKRKQMRDTKFAKEMVGIESTIVTSVDISEGFFLISVRPHWRFPRCSCCGRRAAKYDTRKGRRWTHLSVGKMRVVLQADLRRVHCRRCGVLVEQVPWARSDSHFTKDFEEMTAYLAQVTNQTAVSKLMGISWSTVGAIVARVVGERQDPKALENLRNIGADEFGYLKRQQYITVVVDHDKRRVVWAGEGRGATALNGFFDRLGKEGCEGLKLVTLDMAAGYQKAARERAPNATIIFDRFHVQRLASMALDEVRREEVRTCEDKDEARAIKRSRYALLKNPWDHTPGQARKLAEVEQNNERLYRAWFLKESLAGALDWGTLTRAKAALYEWIRWSLRSELKPFERVGRTVLKHRHGILAYVKYKLTNGLVEGINNKLRTIARRAYGFHSSGPLISMLFLCAGGIQLNPPLPGIRPT